MEDVLGDGFVGHCLGQNRNVIGQKRLAGLVGKLVCTGNASSTSFSRPQRINWDVYCG